MQAEGDNGWDNKRGNGRRLRNTEWGADMSGINWPMAGVGNVQVNGTTLWEMRLVATVTARCQDNQNLLMGRGGFSRIEEATNNKKEKSNTGGAGGVD